MNAGNNTKAFKERCAQKGLHRIIVFDDKRRVVGVKENSDYSVVYRWAFHLFQANANAFIRRREVPTVATWAWEFASEESLAPSSANV